MLTYCHNTSYVLKLPLGTETPSILVPSSSIETSIALIATDNYTTPTATATATSEPTLLSETHAPCEFTCLCTFMDYILCVLAYYVGIIVAGVLSVAIVGGIVLVGGILFVVVVRKCIKRSSMYTYTCTLHNFTRCVPCISGGVFGHIILVRLCDVCIMLTFCNMYCCIMLDGLP